MQSILTPDPAFIALLIGAEGGNEDGFRTALSLRRCVDKDDVAG